MVELGEFLAGAVEADLEAVDLAEPVVAAGFGDPGDQVVADFEEPVALGGVGAQQWASQAGVFVDAGGGVGAAAGAEGDLSAFEVAEEFVPFLSVGAGIPRRVAGPAAGDERAVPVDDLVGVDGLVAHGGVDVAVSGDELGDMGWHAVHDGVGDEEPPEVMGGESERLARRRRSVRCCRVPGQASHGSWSRGWRGVRC